MASIICGCCEGLHSSVAAVRTCYAEAGGRVCEVPAGTYGVGDLIEYRTFGGAPRVVRVLGKIDDIQDGHPGFDGEILECRPGSLYSRVWGYDYQITRVVRWAASD